VASAGARTGGEGKGRSFRYTVSQRLMAVVNSEFEFRTVAAVCGERVGVHGLPVDMVRLLTLWTLVPGRCGRLTLVTGLLVQGRIRQALRSSDFFGECKCCVQVSRR
jgi:hypothetical protein